MALTPSNMLPLGTALPEFSLPDAQGRVVNSNQWHDAKALVVVFMCNHCPYVKHIKPALTAFANDYLPRGVAMVAINSNDFEKYPDDSPEQMRRDVEAFNYPFPYLVDADQQVARAFQAACTPDFYLFDGAQRLVYRGQFDASRPGNEIPVTGADMRAAVEAVLTGAPQSSTQVPSIGCNIKWK